MSLRVNRNLGLKERKVYTFNNFRGVDFSSSPYTVAQNRAILAKNLIYSDGLVRKRNGWESLLKFDSRINGINTFELNGDKFIFVYAGKKFYLVSFDNSIKRYTKIDITDSCTYEPAEIIIEKLVDRRIQVYVSKNKAYIVGCGDYLVFGKYDDNYELRRVYDDEDTYVPTTTINIDNDDANDENRAMLDKVNLLSSYRKNEMLGVDTSTGTWTVDTGSIDENTDITITVQVIENDALSTKTLNNRINADKNSLYLVGDDINSMGSIDYTTGKITLNINTKPPETDTSNIVVLFKKTSEGQSSMIESATVSVLFGGGGNANRLFLGGNTVNKHVHVWSEMYDFTYFSDTNYDEIGNDGSAIMGYVRATDGVLLVFKENNSTEATIYYVTGTDTDQTDSGGNIEFITKFNKYAGDVSDTIVGKYATASLNGDNLILTNGGVKGLDIIDNLTTSAYRVQERSRNINNKLLKEDNLQDACGFVYDNKYYISINDGVYICDSGFRFQTESNIGNSFNYEWWYFDNINARVWCEIEGKLYFGTNDGKLCVFTDNFADIVFQYISENNLTISGENDKIAYNVELDEELKENDTIKLINGDIYALYIDNGVLGEIDEEGNISYPEELMPKIYEGVTFFADRVNDTGLVINTLYKIHSVNLDDLTFTILDENGDIVIPTANTFRMCKKISNKELYVTNIDSEKCEFQIREYLQSQPLDIVYYNSEAPTQICAYLCFKQNVVAEWYSPIYDMGTNMYSKTLLNITIATEPLMKGTIKFGIQTRNTEKYFSTHGNRNFDFDDIDFEDFSFEGSFINSNTIRCKEKNFNFVVLRYISDSQSGCAVSGITIRYKINGINKGVR